LRACSRKPIKTSAPGHAINTGLHAQGLAILWTSVIGPWLYNDLHLAFSQPQYKEQLIMSLDSHKTRDILGTVYTKTTRSRHACVPTCLYFAQCDSC